MRSTFVALASFVALANAATYQLQSLSSAFNAASKQGCVSGSSNADGAAVVIHDCNNEEQAKHTLDFTWNDFSDTGPQQIKFFNGQKCLDVTGGVKASGTKLQLWSCDAVNPNQQWIVKQDHTYQWNGTDLCVDITDGNINDGNQLQVWTCDNRNQNQAFLPQQLGNSFSPPSQIVPLLQAGTFDRSARVSEFRTDPIVTPTDQILYALTAASNADGAGVFLAAWNQLANSPFPNGNQTWLYPTPPLGGQIHTFDGSKCLDVPSGNNANGVKLQVWTCTPGNTNQLFKYDPSTHSVNWVGTNKCIDVTGGQYAVGTALQLWDCDSTNHNQWWFANDVNEGSGNGTTTTVLPPAGGSTIFDPPTITSTIIDLPTSTVSASASQQPTSGGILDPITSTLPPTILPSSTSV
ncbi:hypothetical protein V5O48_017757 [Marasmius crinis-equi]|uniref:Ricin B lectin domain-containing protein n=1 Tax=Marasmius crinis-equi TaxID=585013 RepID=A0ABR3EN95_9AGAR